MHHRASLALRLSFLLCVSLCCWVLIVKPYLILQNPKERDMFNFFLVLFYLIVKLDTINRLFTPIMEFQS